MFTAHYVGIVVTHLCQNNSDCFTDSLPQYVTVCLTQILFSHYILLFFHLTQMLLNINVVVLLVCIFGNSILAILYVSVPGKKAHFVHFFSSEKIMY